MFAIIRRNMSSLGWLAALGWLILLLAPIPVSRTPSEEVSRTVEFYQQAGSSWAEALGFFAVIGWIGFSGLHITGVISEAWRPHRKLAAACLISFAFMIWLMLADLAYGGGGSSGHGGSLAVGLMSFALILILLVPTLDLLLPPWGSPGVV